MPYKLLFESYAYYAARRRCQDPTHRSYPMYGGRGIQFRFNSFDEFFEEVGPKPSPKHSIDRFPNKDGDYEKGNVRWATLEEQTLNRRSTKGIRIGPFTAEHCANIGKAKKGKPSSFTGKHHTPETIAKLKAVVRKRHRHSPETIAQMKVRAISRQRSDTGSFL